VSPFASRPRRYWLALPLPARLYLGWQLIMPMVAWAAGSHRFSWAMYSQFQPAPEVFVQHRPGGAFEPVDLVRILGHLRAEVSYDGRFVRELCRVSGARVVRMIPAGRAPSDHPC
jgi:hypothetical protein